MAGIIHSLLPAAPGWLRAVCLSLCVLLSSCATDKELFVEYASDFCPVPVEGSPVVIEKIVEKEVLRDRLVVKEVPASSTSLPWEPAVYFDSDDTSISTRAREILTENVRFLKKFPQYRVSVRGFTDQHATVEYNRRLSEKRTDSVIEFFTLQDISENRFVVHAHGESVALSDSVSPFANEISRRVEMILLDQQGRPDVTYQRFATGTGE